MIRSLQITDSTRTPVQWWPDVPALKAITTLEFNEAGLTILWGPNGVGKSTIIRALARLTHCEQGGVPRVTSASFDVFRRRGTLEDEANDGMTIVSDGQPTFLFDPGATPGLIGGQFDDDFITEGLAQVMRVQKTSSGQQTNANSGRVFEEALKMKGGVDMRFFERMSNHSKTTVTAAKQGLAKTSEKKGKRTILLDEPERSLDIPTQRHFWHIFALQSKFQIIAATHCPFALWVEGATYIDLQPGYLDQCRAEFKAFLQQTP